MGRRFAIARGMQPTVRLAVLEQSRRGMALMRQSSFVRPSLLHETLFLPTPDGRRSVRPQRRLHDHTDSRRSQTTTGYIDGTATGSLVYRWIELGGLRH